MRGFDRFFLFLYSIVFLGVAVFAMMIGLGFYNTYVSETINLLYLDQDVKFTIIAVSFLIIVFSIYFIIKSVHTNNVPTFSNLRSDIGEIKISMETIESLASKVSAKVKGVREEKVKVRLDDNELVTIIIKINVDGETPIPQISDEIQRNVKQHIENIAGITVGQVHVVVSNVGHSNYKKVR